MTEALMLILGFVVLAALLRLVYLLSLVRGHTKRDALKLVIVTICLTLLYGFLNDASN